MNRIENYYNGLVQEFQSYSELLFQSPAPETIHKLRVTAKRINAALLFWAYINNQKNGTLSSELTKYFRLTGKIRDFQVLDSLHVEAQNSSPINIDFYSEFLKANEQKQLVKLKKWLISQAASTKFELPELSLNGIELNLTPSESYGLDFKMHNQKKISHLLKHGKKDKSYHEIRKLLKQIIHVNDLINAVGLPAILNATEISTYKQIATLLGNWHDALNGRKYLRKYKKEYTKATASHNKVGRRVIESFYKSKGKHELESAKILLHEITPKQMPLLKQVQDRCKCLAKDPNGKRCSNFKNGECSRNQPHKH